MERKLHEVSFETLMMQQQAAGRWFAEIQKQLVRDGFTYNEATGHWSHPDDGREVWVEG